MDGARIARAAGAVAAVPAGLALLGWVSGVHRLAQIVLGEGAMRPESALAALAAAAAIFCHLRGRARCAGALAAIVVLIGFEALLAYAFDGLFAIHASLPPLEGTLAGPVLATPTAVAYVLVGVALAIARSRARAVQRIFDVCVGAVLLIATLSLLARSYHVLGVGVVGEAWSFRATSLPAAVALLALGIGIAGLRPDRGMAAAMLDRGPAGVLLRHFAPAAVLVPVLLGWLHAWAEDQTGALASVGLAAYAIANVGLLLLVAAYATKEVRKLDADRAETHRTLVASEEAYRRTFLGVPVGVGTLDRSMKIRSANPALCRMLGYDEGELVGRSLAELGLPWDHRDDETNALKLFAGEIDTYRLERRYRRKDGGIFEASLLATAVRDEQGRALFAVGVIQDLTEHKRLEATLVEREARYRLMAESSPQIVWVAGPDGAIEYLSAEWSRYAGCVEGAELGTCWRARIHPDDVERRAAAWAEAVENVEPYELEYRLRRRDGAYHWFLSRAVPACHDGKIAKWYGADTDIHELRETREALRISEQRFRLALLGSPVAMVAQDTQLRFTWVHNPSPGFEPEKSLGKTDREVHERPEDGELLASLKQRVIDTGERLHTSVRVMVGGELRDYDLWLDPLRDAYGEIAGVTGSAYDVTERVRLEERLRHTQKLESLGALAGGLAHGFNNFLTVVIGNAVRLRDSIEGDDARTRLAPALDEIVTAGEGAAALTNQLLAYSGKGRFFVEPIDLGGEIHRLADSLRPTMPPNIELVLDSTRCTARVEADVAEIDQLVTNLVLNATEAIGDARGTIALRVVRRDLEQGSPEGLPAGPYCGLEVSDDGPGMDADTLQRVFDPFFSTKLVGRGLGLPAAQGIARAHRGAIYATSAPGRGTVFHVLLPSTEIAVEAPSFAEERPSATRRIPAAGGLVLFVDDEPPLRHLAESILRDAGYDVLLAEHGEAALALVSRHGREIDVVVLDMSMPVLDGVETAERLRILYPDLPIIASSGYSEAELRAKFASTRPEFLRKPYRPRELVTKVRAALASRRAQAGARARS